jgi:hypothetical protein
MDIISINGQNPDDLSEQELSESGWRRVVFCAAGCLMSGYVRLGDENIPKKICGPAMVVKQLPSPEDLIFPRFSFPCCAIPVQKHKPETNKGG